MRLFELIASLLANSHPKSIMILVPEKPSLQEIYVVFTQPLDSELLPVFAKQPRIEEWNAYRVDKDHKASVQLIVFVFLFSAVKRYAGGNVRVSFLKYSVQRGVYSSSISNAPRQSTHSYLEPCTLKANHQLFYN